MTRSASNSQTKDASFAGWIGISREDITPPPGIYSGNWGAAKHESTEGIHRPLTLTCFTFQDSENGSPLVLISADLGWWKSAADERSLRSSILHELGLEPSRLMFCLSHTHAGPSLFSEDAFRPGGEHIAAYLGQILEKAIGAARKALDNAVWSTLAWRYGRSALAAIRDLREKETGRFIVGFSPGEKADDTLLVGRISGAQGEVRGTLVNYACHPTVLGWANRMISPDYVGGMREVVEESTGAPCLFLQGASGELAPPEQYTGDLRLADAYGRELGYAALSVLEAMLPPHTQLVFDRVVESGASLAVWKKTAYEPSDYLKAVQVNIEMKLKPLAPLAEIEDRWRSCTDPVMKERLWRMRGIRKTVGEGSTCVMPVWLWRLGDVLLAGQPNEAYSIFQQMLRQALAPCPAAVMNIVNGYAGYLPPRELYKEDLYTVWQTPFAEGSLEQLTASAIEAAKKVLFNESATLTSE